jgi:O-antigen ligase
MRINARKTIYIDSRTILFSIILIVFLEPPFFSMLSMYSQLDTIFDYARILISVLAAFYLAFNRDFYFESKKQILLFTLIFITPVISALVNSGDTFTMLSQVLFYFVPVLFVPFYFRDDIYRMFSVLCNYLTILCSINLITQIMFPGGLYINYNTDTFRHTRYWLLGGENHIVCFALPLLFLSILLFKDRNRKSHIISAIIAVSNVFFSGSATGIVGCVVFVLLSIACTFVYRFNKNSKLFKIETFLLLIVVFFFIVLFMTSSGIVQMIALYFGKDPTLSNRTVVWGDAIEAIIKKPILGYGDSFSVYAGNRLSAGHEHDYYLHLLFRGGVVVLGAFWALLQNVKKKLNRVKNTIFYYVFSSFVFAFLLMLITEVYGETQFLIPFYMILFSSLFYSREKDSVIQ